MKTTEAKKPNLAELAEFVAETVLELLFEDASSVHEDDPACRSLSEFDASDYIARECHYAEVDDADREELAELATKALRKVIAEMDRRG